MLQRGADHRETTMNRTSIIALAAAAIFAGIGLGPSVASAGDWLRADIRADKRYIRADRLDLRRDRADLREDYRDLYRDLRSGRFGDAGRDLADIRRDRNDIRS